MSSRSRFSKQVSFRRPVCRARAAPGHIGTTRRRRRASAAPASPAHKARAGRANPAGESRSSRHGRSPASQPGTGRGGSDTSSTARAANTLAASSSAAACSASRPASSLKRPGIADAQPPHTIFERRRIVGHRLVSRCRIARVVPGQSLQNQRAILGVRRERPAMIQAKAERHDAPATHPPVSRLQPHNAAICRRQPDRSAGIGAKGHWHDPGSDRNARAGTGTAGEMFGFQGFSAGGHSVSQAGPPVANSCVASLPIITMPAASRRAVVSASALAILSRKSRECAVVRHSFRVVDVLERVGDAVQRTALPSRLDFFLCALPPPRVRRLRQV